MKNNVTAPDTALELIKEGLYPVAIYPDRKKPIGDAWGAERWTVERATRAYRKNPRAGVGICLGPGRAPDGGWLIDVEGDGPEADRSRAILFGGKEVKTTGWGSVRGPHGLLRVDPARMSALMLRLSMCEGKGVLGTGVYHFRQLPKLELRIGGTKADGTVKQIQSVCPPTPGTDGKPREWNGVEAIADAPEAFYGTLERIAAEIEAENRSLPTALPEAKPTTNGAVWHIPVTFDKGSPDVETRVIAYLDKCDPSISGDGGHDAAFSAACKIGPGFDLPREAALRMLREHFNPKCKPPWSEKELIHKVDDSYKVETRRGWLLNAEWKKANGESKAKNKSTTAIVAEEVPEGFGVISDEDMGIISLESVECRSIRWLWRYRFSRGGLSVMAGDGGIGKSQALLWMAATVSNGSAWADGSGNSEVGDVIIVSAEDRPDDTIKPRLMAMGADLSRITIVKAKVTIRKPGKPPVIHPTSFQDIPYWQEIFRRRPNCKLFIVDPLPSYLGRGVNDSKNIEVRNILEPFLDMVIMPLDICMIGNMHLNKTVDAKTPMHRISGSIAYGNLPRNVHFVVRDPDEPGRRFLKQAKCNNAPEDLPALAFKIEAREIVNNGGEVIETAIPVFEAETLAVNLEDAVNGKPAGQRGPKPEKTNKVAEWLHDFLIERPGAVALGAIFDAAGEAGLIGHIEEGGVKWSNPAALYRGKKMVPHLQEPRSGRKIEVSEAPWKMGGKIVVHWSLVCAEVEF